METPFSDPVLIFATVMVLILLSPIAVRRFKIPGMVGLIMAGMVVGPHGLGWLARDATIELLGHVGLLFIMFICGLEIDLHRARRQRTHSIVFGLLTFAIPMALGTAVGLFTLRMSLAAAVLMASMFASHTLLTVPIVGKLGLSKSRAVTTTIGGTMITDTLAMLVLAVVAAGQAGHLGPLFWLLLCIKIVLYMAAVIILTPLVGRWFLRTFSTDENIEYVAMLAIAFAASYLAHTAGLEPIIGAFLAGLSLNSLIPEKSGLMSRISFTGNALFIPFFLLSVGMLVNLAVFWQGTGAWKAASGMVAVALLAKWLAARISGKWLGYSRDEAGLIFGLSVNQAAATLAAAMVGYRIGLFDEAIITGTIIMIGVTCVAGPILSEKFGRAVALRSRHDLEEPPEAPRRILLPIHDKDRAKEMLDLAFFLRGDGSHEPLYPIHVTMEGPRAELDLAHGENLIAHTIIRSLSANVPVNPQAVVDVNAPSGILRAARENRISLISMFWDGNDSHRSRAFGMIIDRVISDSRQMVFVNRIIYNISTAKHILLLCPPFISLQPGFAEALTAIKSVVKQTGATLILFTPEATRDILESYASKAKPTVPLSCIPYQNWKSILDQVAEELHPCDWIVTMAARIGQVAWQPSLERLPRQMSRRFPEHNFSFVYPSEESGGRAIARDKTVHTDLGGVLTPDTCTLGVDSADLQSILARLLGSLPGMHRGGAGGTIHALCTIAATEPVELEPGIILLHDHSACVTEPQIFLATSTQPIEVAGTQTPVRVVIVLLDPVGQDPAGHLAALSRVAGLMTLPGFKEQILLADSFPDLARRLGEQQAEVAG